MAQNFDARPVFVESLKLKRIFFRQTNAYTNRGPGRTQKIESNKAKTASFLNVP